MAASTSGRTSRDTLPLDDLGYTLTPMLALSLTHCHRLAGLVAGRRFSTYALQKLRAKARRLRVEALVGRIGTSVSPDEVAHVLRGANLPKRAVAYSHIRSAALLCDAVEMLSSGGAHSTPEIAAAYVELASNSMHIGPTHWARLIGRSRVDLLKAIAKDCAADSRMRRVYEWMETDDLLSTEPLCRAIVLGWASWTMLPYSPHKMATDALIDHELRAGGLDPHGLFVVSTAGTEPEPFLFYESMNALRIACDTGDLTRLLEREASATVTALSSLEERIDVAEERDHQDTWLVVRPPDELDRRIFEAITRLGHANSRQILDALAEPRPPLRTLQRRLQQLCRDGLVEKRGSRRDASYLVPLRL